MMDSHRAAAQRRQTAAGGVAPEKARKASIAFAGLFDALGGCGYFGSPQAAEHASARAEAADEARCLRYEVEEMAICVSL